jgi:hypothetical protein
MAKIVLILIALVLAPTFVVSSSGPTYGAQDQEKTGR